MFKAAANPYDDVIAKATDENQTSEDWGILATVWDKVNDDGATGARNCALAIQKRLQHRNANVQLYALTLSDALVNNCKIDLHREISSRAFTQTLTRMVQDRTTHDKVRKRVMQLLKEWSQAFKKDATLGIVEETYDSLKRTYRAADEPQTRPESSSHRLMKQEEEDMQRAIAESEALAKQQQQRQGHVPSLAPAVNSYASSGQYFNSSDAKALPSIQPQASTSQVQQTVQQASAPVQPTAPSRVKALYDFEPQEEGELAFRRGDVIRVVNSAYEGWWKGELDGRVGIFPLTYIEIIPDPTPDSILRDAEVEAQVFAQAGSVDRLLSMLSAADAQGSSISEDDDLMELYQQCILLRPKIVKLLDKYSQKQKDLSSLHDKWKVAKNAYDSMLEESYQRSQVQATSRYAGYGPAQQGQQMPQVSQMQPQQQRNPSGQVPPGQHGTIVDQPPIQSGQGYGPPGGTQYQYGPQPQQQDLPQPGGPYLSDQGPGSYRPGPPQSQAPTSYHPSQPPLQSPPQIVVDPHIRSISPGHISQQQQSYGSAQASIFQHQTAQQRAQANGYA